MRVFLKGNKGINLISLTIAVSVIMILTGIIIVNSTKNLKSTKLGKMQADIDNLRDKVSNYYLQYGEIPADKNIEYTNISHINSISSAVDTGAFYVIDLSAMENVTLNYGKDYEKIRNNEVTTEEEINKLTDLYIINEDSHNIFYVEGIELDDEMFYTDYTKGDADKQPVESQIIEPGVKADKNKIYIDDGKVATIPQGFTILPEASKIDDGLVIEDVDGNQFVWIPVETAVSETEQDGNTNKAMAVKVGENYRGLLYDFTSTESTVKENCTAENSNQKEPDIIYWGGSGFYDDYYYDKAGFYSFDAMKTGLQEEYNKMIESVEKYHGFYIGRYELGVDTNKNNIPTSKKSGGTVATADSSQPETYRWYGLYKKCKEFSPESEQNSVVSSMMWGSQYDAMLNWMQANGIKVDQSETGNSSVETGKNENDKLKNIYDLNGAHYDWTVEANLSSFRILRGGYNRAFYGPDNRADRTLPSATDANFSSRITLYIR